MTREEALAVVSSERDRQQALWAGRHEWGHGDCSGDGVDAAVKVAVLGEEFGEVARAVLERDPAALKTELTQVAAVAVAWLESL